MVEGARLESVYTGNRIAGSNPASSANYNCKLLILFNLKLNRAFGLTIGLTIERRLGRIWADEGGRRGLGR